MSVRSLTQYSTQQQILKEGQLSCGLNICNKLSIMRVFIRAEKLGDFELHLYAISMMIPLFKSSGHFPYEKSSRVYLDQMRDLNNNLTEEEYDVYANKGMFTVRRSEKHWGVIFTD